MGVTGSDTKVAVVVREDLATWQKLNVTAFLTSGVVADAGAQVVGEPYEDADGCRYLPMLRQPVLVFAATRDKLATLARGAGERDVPWRSTRPSSSRRAETRTIAPRSGGRDGRARARRACAARAA